MSASTTDHPAGRSIGGERSDQHQPQADLRPGGNALGRTPDESSFGTLQEDGTYCGVFCAENH